MMECVKEKQTMSIATLAVIGVMTAVTCILGPLSVPIGVVPISLTNFAVYCTVIILGCRKGTISCLIYLLMGLIGIPVFSGFSSGPAKLFGPTGGYLIGFVFTALILGWFVDRYAGKVIFYIVGMVLGTIVLYVMGTAWLAYETGMTIEAALWAGVIPFIMGDVAKMAVAAMIAPIIKKQLIRAQLLG